VTLIRNKTKWLSILIVIISAFVIGEGILFLQDQSISKELAAELEPLIAQKQIPVPTEINQNFSTQVNECFIPGAAVYGYTLRVISGFRSLADQAVIYQSGRVVDGHIVSWAEPGKSIHNYGFAVDVVDRWKGYNIDWIKLAKIGAFCGLEQVDDSHFEHRGGLTTAQFETGMRLSPLTLPCALMDERAKANKPLTLTDLKNCGAPKF